MTVPALAAPSGHRWQTYANARFAYEICYPADLLVPAPEADNGDGRTFAGSDGAVLRAWGQYNALDRNVAQAAAAERTRLVRGGAVITFSAVRPAWFVLSGRVGDALFYTRTELAGERFIAFDLRYPATAAARWGPVAARLSRCLAAF